MITRRIWCRNWINVKRNVWKEWKMVHDLMSIKLMETSHAWRTFWKSKEVQMVTIQLWPKRIMTLAKRSKFENQPRTEIRIGVWLILISRGWFSFQRISDSFSEFFVNVKKSVRLSIRIGIEEFYISRNLELINWLLPKEINRILFHSVWTSLVVCTSGGAWLGLLRYWTILIMKKEYGEAKVNT